MLNAETRQSRHPARTSASASASRSGARISGRSGAGATTTGLAGEHAVNVPSEARRRMAHGPRIVRLDTGGDKIEVFLIHIDRRQPEPRAPYRRPGPRAGARHDSEL